MAVPLSGGPIRVPSLSLTASPHIRMPNPHSPAANDTRFFRVIPSFMVQFGLSGDPATSSKWRSMTIQDEPVKVSNKPGYITFAKTGAPNSRTTQLFINYVDNGRLDGMGFAPFGEVEGDGMAVVKKIFNW